MWPHGHGVKMSELPLSISWMFNEARTKHVFDAWRKEKIYVVDARLVKDVIWICLGFDMDLSMFWNGFVRVFTWISHSCYVHFPLGKRSMKKKRFLSGIAPISYSPPPMTPIRATWSFFFGRQNSRFESHSGHKKKSFAKMWGGEGDMLST